MCSVTPTTVRDTVEGMSDALIEPPVPAPAPVTVGPSDGEHPETVPGVAPRPRLNALAVASLILAILLSPLAALFGHIAVGQIARSRGRERGAVIAWVAVGLGYLWVLAVVVAGIAVWQAFGA